MEGGRSSEIPCDSGYDGEGLIAAKGRDRRCTTAWLLVLHLNGIVVVSHARVLISIHGVVFSTIRSVLKPEDHLIWKALERIVL